ncbi:MAG: glucose-6-phosphate isomerase family protein [Culicoidibacterales bacterium]
MKIVEPRALHFIESGVIEGKEVEHYKKPFSGVINLYQNRKRAEELADTVAYTVYSYTAGNPEQKGNLNWGLTILHPILVDGECNMTRGHFHEDRDCAEFYFGIEGKGLLLLMDNEGNTWAETVFSGSLHHINGQLAHRLVNTGNSDLKVGACWPTTAGHNYAAIVEKNFGYRIFLSEKGKVIQRKRVK